MEARPTICRVKKVTLSSGRRCKMGNQLSSIAPSQILSVDHYFSDLRDYEYDIRYFKSLHLSHYATSNLTKQTVLLKCNCSTLIYLYC